jgi:hypothetical protein
MNEHKLCSIVYNLCLGVSGRRTRLFQRMLKQLDFLKHHLTPVSLFGILSTIVETY